MKWSRWSLLVVFLVGCQSVPDARRELPPPQQDNGPGGRTGPVPGGAGAIGEIADQILQEDERRFVAEEYVRQGKAHYFDFDYERARRAFEEAYRVNPSDPEARLWLDRIYNILGIREGEIADAGRRFAERRIVQIKQNEVEMKRLFSEAQALYERGRFDEALENFERVLEIIRWFPYNIDHAATRDETVGWIEKTKTKAKESDALFRENLERGAIRNALHQRQANIRNVEANLKSLQRKAAEFFDRERYSRTERICDEILDLDPDNKAAEDLKYRAIEARHLASEIRSIELRVEHQRRQFEHVDLTAVPIEEILLWPDRDFWQDVRNREIPISSALEGRQFSEAEQKIQSMLDNFRVNFNFPGETTLTERVEEIRRSTHLPIVLTSDAKDVADEETNDLILNQAKLGVALNHLVAQYEDLTWKIADGVVYITTTDDESVSDFHTAFYNVGDILNKLEDYPAPEIALTTTAGGDGGGGGGGGLLGDDDDDDTSGGLEADKLIELIIQTLGEENEDIEPEITGGLLFLRAPLRVHQEVAKLLKALQRTVGIVVTVEARFIDVQDNFLEEIGVEYTGLPPDPGNISDPNTILIDGIPVGGTIPQVPNPGPLGGAQSAGYVWRDRRGLTDIRAAANNFFTPLGIGSTIAPFNITPTGGLTLQADILETFQLQAIIEAVSKKQVAREVYAPRVTLFNSQRAHVLSIQEQAYISDVDIDNTGSVPVLDPVIGILRSGVILEAKPTVSHDRRFVTLEIKPTLAIFETFDTFNLNLRGGLTNIDITLPTLRVARIRSTVTIPDGGTVLLGGLRQYREVESERGIPILSSIPLIKHLFSRQGRSVLRRSMVVLLRADITVVREEEARLFNEDEGLGF